MNLQGKTVLVMGLGDTGLAAARWLAGQGARVRVADSRATPPNAGALQAEVPAAIPVFGPFSNDLWADADLIVLSPGLTRRQPVLAAARAAGLEVIGDVELFARVLGGLRPPPRVLAITGSNGKSTVTQMTGDLCRAAGLRTVVAGNIGLPVLNALETAAREGYPDVYVLELSSYQLETLTHLDATAATVLNISEDHLDRYVDLEDYTAAKVAIFRGHGRMVLNRDDPACAAMAWPGREAVSFGLNPPPDPADFGLIESSREHWLCQGAQKLMPARELPLEGRHNAANALAALALCRTLDLPYAPLLQALRQFHGLPHRVEKVAEIAGVVFIDDSKGTNVGATEAALRGMDRPVVLIAGGDGKGQDFRPLRNALATARAVVLIGRDAPLIAAALEGTPLPVLRAVDMDDAVRQAFALAQPGDAVLLSPACASWDMFRNYAHRAEAFIAAARALSGEAG